MMLMRAGWYGVFLFTAVAAWPEVTMLPAYLLFIPLVRTIWRIENA